MVKIYKILRNVLIFGSMYGSAQNPPQNEAILKTAEKIVSVEGKTTIESVGKWFSNHKKADVGTIASPEDGWQNRARIHGVDCEAVFQIVPRSSITCLNELHPWLKFPFWTRISVGKIKIGKYSAFVLSRSKINDHLFDNIYLTGLDKDRVVIVRMIALGPSSQENRVKATQEFIQFILRDTEKNGCQELDKSKIDAKLFKDKRDAPLSLANASEKLAQSLTSEEKNHLLRNIQNEYELIERWPVIGDKVPRLHWIMVYWGLNDPSSLLRKSIRISGEDIDNNSYILEVLKSTEKLLREK